MNKRGTKDFVPIQCLVSLDSGIITYGEQEYFKPCGEFVWHNNEGSHYCVKPVNHGSRYHESMLGHSRDQYEMDEDRRRNESISEDKLVSDRRLKNDVAPECQKELDGGQMNDQVDERATHYWETNRVNDRVKTISGMFASPDNKIISFDGANYYQACDAVVYKDDVVTAGCVKRVGHKSDHEDYEGRSRPQDVDFGFLFPKYISEATKDSKPKESQIEAEDSILISFNATVKDEKQKEFIQRRCIDLAKDAITLGIDISVDQY